MILASRPGRFLTIVVIGWVGVRAALLWPAAEVLPALIRAVAPPASAEPIARALAAAVLQRPSALAVAPVAIAARIASSTPSGVVPETPTRHRAADPVRVALAGPIPLGSVADAASPGTDRPPVFRTSRLSGSTWAILRPGGRATPFASQLGGSQAGVRLAYAIDAPRRLAMVARFSTALETRQKEAAIGLDWKPTRLPIHLVAEQRIAIEGTRGGLALGVIGGVGPVPIGSGFRLEAYAQAGAIARGGIEGYADGQMRLTRPVAALGKARIELGAGAWGATQRDASRLDIGPSLGVAVPIGRNALRVSLDWRQRIAGDSRPGSGPALSLGTDF